MSAIDDENRHIAFPRERRLLESALGGALAEASWRRLLDSGMLSDYSSGRESWEDLLAYAEELLDYQRELKGELLGEPGASHGEGVSEDSKAGRPGLFTVELPEREQKRAEVLLEIGMRWGASHPEVLSFRAERLGGRLLCAEEAERAYFTPGAPYTTDAELADLGRRLERDFGWHAEDAVWFVLTGESPTPHPLAAGFKNTVTIYGPSYCELTIHVAPWVPAEEVKRVFLQMREQVRGDKSAGAVSERRLEVLRFVEAEHARSGLRPGSEAMREAFNREYPHWSYPGRTSFLKAYREAYQEVLYPEYHSPRRESTPNIERQEARTRKFFEALRKTR